MRKALLVLLLLLPRLAFSQGEVTVTGTVAGATSGYVEFKIMPWSSGVQYYVVGGPVIANQATRCGINSLGQVKNLALTNPCMVWGNDKITPGNTTYTVVFAPRNTVTNTVARESITGTAYDLSTPVFAPVVNIVPQYQTITTSPISVNLIPAANEAFDIGQNGVRYSAIYAKQLFTDNLNFNSLSLVNLTVSGNSTLNNLSVTGTFTPNTITANSGTFTTLNATTINSTNITNASGISTGTLTASTAISGPAATFDSLSVGASRLLVNSSGNLTKINNVTYTWPGSQGGVGSCLTNNGSGTLTWGACGSGGSVGPGTTNKVTKFTSASTIGDSTLTDTGTLVSTSATRLVVGGTTDVSPGLPAIVVMGNAGGVYSQNVLAGSYVAINSPAAATPYTSIQSGGAVVRPLAVFIGNTEAAEFRSDKILIEADQGLNFAGSPTQVGEAGRGILYFDTALNKFRCSQNGAAMVDCLSGSGTIGGSGTANRITKFSAVTTLSDSSITDTGTLITTGGRVIVGAAGSDVSAVANVLGVVGSAAGLYALSADTDASALILSTATGSGYTAISSGHTGGGAYLPLTMFTNGSERLRLQTDGTLSIGTQVDSSFMVDVNGSTRAASLTLTGASFSVNGLSYTWPGSQTPATCLGNDGSGVLSWSACGATSIPSTQVVYGTGSGITSSSNLTYAAGQLNITGGSFKTLTSGQGYVFSSGNESIANNGSGDILFYTGGTEKLRILSSGRVLLGLTSSDVGGLNDGQLLSHRFMGVASATSNASTLTFTVVPGTSVNIGSNLSAAGTLLPMKFFMQSTEMMRFTTAVESCIFISGTLRKLGLSGSNIVDAGACP